MSKLPFQVPEEGQEAEQAAPTPARGEIPKREVVAQASQSRALTDRVEGQVRRRPRFGSSKLGVDCAKLHAQGWYCHWINDYPGRVQDAIESGYQFVAQSEIESTPVFGSPNGADNPERVCRRVGVMDDGHPLVAYLMKIRQEYKNENDAYYQERCDQIDRQIRTGTVGGQIENSYRPQGEPIKYTQRSR